MGILLLFGWTLLFSFQSEARVFIVTDTADSIGIQSLRGAIIAANRLGGRNIIQLGGASSRGASRKIYHLTLPGQLEDHALTGDLDITGSLTIIGSGKNVVIDATALNDRVFEVLPGAQLSLIGLTITGGRAPVTDFFDYSRANGGAIFNAGTLTLQKCTLANNTAGGAGDVLGNGFGLSGGSGGALYNSGTALITDCSIEENLCDASGYGGGIKNDGTCLLTRCSISSNRTGDGIAGGHGGGIFNSGKMSLKDCVIDKNACGNGSDGGDPTGTITIFTPGRFGGFGGFGGGIYNLGRMQIDDSSIYQNHSGHGGSGGAFSAGGGGGAGGNGGGIFNSGELSANNTTVSGNICGAGGNGGDGSMLSGGSGASGGSGGGIFNMATLNLTSCTIVSNRTDIGGNGGSGSALFQATIPANGGSGGNGGGILNAGTSAASLRNTLIALNAVASGGQAGTNTFQLINSDPTNSVGSPGADGIGADLAGTFISGGFNLVGMVDEGADISNADNGDMTGTGSSSIDPLIGPLQLNGGSTPTHALLPGSPAINQGDCFKLRKDQRGVKRPFEEASIPNAPGGDGSDIGAFELSGEKKRN